MGNGFTLQKLLMDFFDGSMILVVGHRGLRLGHTGAQRALDKDRD